VAAHLRHCRGGRVEKGSYQVAPIFGVKLRGYARRIHQIAEHHRDMPPLAAGFDRGGDWCGGHLRLLETLCAASRLRLECGCTRGCCRGSGGKLADGSEHFPPMPEQDADVLEVLIGQMGNCRDINPVFSKTLGVLGHAEPFEPVCNLLHSRPPTDLTLSVLDRQDRKSTTRADLLHRPAGGVAGPLRVIELNRSRGRALAAAARQ
jgi:hypothetical protein